MEIFLFFILMLLFTPLLGQYIVKLINYKRTRLHPLFEWLEQLCYRIGNINPWKEMGWQAYLTALLLFNGFGLLFLFAIQLIQGVLPLNPQNLPGVPPLLALNTAISFVTNTNWQSYSGEVTLSYFSQMVGLTVQNFVSAATGLATLLAFIRGFIRQRSNTIGNFWGDLVRMVVYLFIPLSFLFAIILSSQGVVQTIREYKEVTTLEGARQVIPLGPVASQEAIKQLGTNGGGFFGVNSAHPFENPTAFTNLLETFAILWIPAALVFAYGYAVGAPRQGFLLLGVMSALLLTTFALSLFSQQVANNVLGVNPVWEGIETRVGTGGSILWSVTTTATANGSVNAMLSSLSPLSGGISLFNILLGELVFGGVGVGLASMLMFVLLTVFLSGLMVGRTPEYLGKKIEKWDIQWVVVAILVPASLTLVGSGVAIAFAASTGPHGLTEILYAFASTAGNNGSAFASLDTNNNFYHITLGLTMLLARLAILVPSLAIAGNMAAKKSAPYSVGTFSTDNLLFAILLMSVILIVGALTYFPALALGPIVEQLLMHAGVAL